MPVLFHMAVAMGANSSTSSPAHSVRNMEAEDWPLRAVLLRARSMAWWKGGSARPRRRIPGGLTRSAATWSSFPLKLVYRRCNQCLVRGVGCVTIPILERNRIVNRQGYDCDRRRRDRRQRAGQCLARLHGDGDVAHGVHCKLQENKILHNSCGGRRWRRVTRDKLGFALPRSSRGGRSPDRGWPLRSRRAGELRAVRVVRCFVRGAGDVADLLGRALLDCRNARTQGVECESHSRRGVLLRIQAPTREAISFANCACPTPESQGTRRALLR